MISEITKKMESLNKLRETANNPKILWEEMKIVADKSFKLQEDILELIKQAEETEQNVAALQSLFETREMVWDIIDEITTLEIKSKEKAHTKQSKCSSKKECDCSKEGCCSHEDNEEECHGHCCCHKH